MFKNFSDIYFYIKHYCLTTVILALLLLFSTSAALAENRYVGTEACRECHEEPYKNFKKYAKKAHSFNAIKKMRDHLSGKEVKTCYHCHTTGYGKPGGFIDENTTPDMAHAGCEVCHGPGEKHVESGDPADILGADRLSARQCSKCHSKDRVKAFNFKPLLHGGAH